VWRQRRQWAPARGQAANDPTHVVSRRTGTRSSVATRFVHVLARWQRRERRRWEPERGQAVVEWTQCWRRGSSTGSSRIPTRGQAVARRSLPVRGSEVGEGLASRLLAQVSSNYEEVSRERRRRCRGPDLWLWQRPRWQRGKFLWISLPFYLFYRWSLS
jgi:hypothetical protein